MQAAITGLAAMPAARMPAAKRAKFGSLPVNDVKVASNHNLVSDTLEVLEPYASTELSNADRQRAASEARDVVRNHDKLLEKMLDVRIITTQKDSCLQNHVNLRIAGEFASMIYHERAQVENTDIMFCFMASCELEPVVVVVLVEANFGRLVQLTLEHFKMLEIALQQFRVRFGLQGETYSYTTLEARSTCSWHSRHFHLKIRVPSEMYLRIFPAMQLLGNNLACKRGILDTYKQMWEPLRYKFELKTQKPWHDIRGLVLADVR
jgi:hypothetical protein